MAHTTRTTSDERKAGGRWLKQRREALGLTQREIASLVGYAYVATVAEVESGKGRVPPNRYAEWASALKIGPRDFVQELRKYYDRDAWNIHLGRRRLSSSTDSPVHGRGHCLLPDIRHLQA